MTRLRFDAARCREVLPRRADGPEQEAGSRAAVAIVFREREDDAEVLLIRRARRADDPWSGHMAFPGGREDPGDADLYATAVREAREETGADLERDAELLGRLEDLPAMARGKATGMLIAPFVFVLRAEAPLEANRDEVEALVWAPVALLASLEAAVKFPYEFDGRTLELPGIQVGEDVVWGLTHRMLTQLFDLLASPCAGPEPAG